MKTLGLIVMLAVLASCGAKGDPLPVSAEAVESPAAG